MSAHLRTDWIRVQDTNSGAKLTIAESAFDPAEAERLKEPAVDENGAPLPPEAPEALKSLSSKSSGQKATDKEGA